MTVCFFEEGSMGEFWQLFMISFSISLAICLIGLVVMIVIV